jgi:putative flippase GtrA
MSSVMLALIEWLVGALPAPVRRHISPTHLQVLAQMAQFGTVGLIGFVVDTAVVYAVRNLVGLYVAGTLAYGVAVTTTWWLNRIWTFRGLGNIGPKHRQWMKFVVASMPGLSLNLGTYFALVASVPFCAVHPVIAIACGAVAGMTANYLLSRAVVFR